MLSCPQEGTEERLLGALAVEYARGYTSLFLERFESTLAREAPGLEAVLRGWLARQPLYGPKSFESAEGLGFAGIREAVLTGDEEDAVREATQLGLWLGLSGVVGDWRVETGTPIRLHLGRWYLPSATDICVSMRMGRISLTTTGPTGSDKLEFRRSRNGWVGSGVESWPVCKPRGCRFIIAPPDALDGEPTTASNLPTSRVARQSADAISLIAKGARVYLGWVRRVIRYIVPVHAGRTLIKSGSSESRPGMIQVSFPARREALAEMLVHEASHQYFRLATHFQDVDDGTDDQLYYSPVKGTGRPIRFILMAYHAFANVLLYYRACRAVGAGFQDYFDENEESLVPELRQLESALRETRALTPAGHALWRPLSKRIN